MKSASIVGVRAVLVLFTVLLICTGAASAEPRSSKAKTALRKYDKAIEKARADYDAVAKAAAKALSSEIDDALKTAMKSGSLEEAKAIEAAKAERLAAASQQTSGNLDGEWVVVFDNGVERRYAIHGDQFSVQEGSKTVSGVFQNTPNGVVCEEPSGKIDRITKAGNRFFIEHFTNPQTDFPGGRPTAIGIGMPKKK